MATSSDVIPNDEEKGPPLPPPSPPTMRHNIGKGHLDTTLKHHSNDLARDVEEFGYGFKGLVDIIMSSRMDGIKCLGIIMR